MASNRTKCQLASGHVLPYHAASPLDSGPCYDPLVFDYMGTGVVYSVGGVLQQGDTRLRFYRLRSDRPGWAR